MSPNGFTSDFDSGFTSCNNSVRVLKYGVFSIWCLTLFHFERAAVWVINIYYRLGVLQVEGKVELTLCVKAFGLQLRTRHDAWTVGRQLVKFLTLFVMEQHIVAILKTCCQAERALIHASTNIVEFVLLDGFKLSTPVVAHKYKVALIGNRSVASVNKGLGLVLCCVIAPRSSCKLSPSCRQGSCTRTSSFSSSLSSALLFSLGSVGFPSLRQNLFATPDKAMSAIC